MSNQENTVAPVSAEQPSGSKITDGDSARLFIAAWHREHFPTDRTFTNYIMGRNKHCALAGDFAWQLAKALESMDTARLASKSQAAPVAWSDAQREAARDALSATLGDAMDCTRVWSAWGVGTMSQDDFQLLADNDERLDELVGAVEAATLAAPVAEAVPPSGLEFDGYHDSDEHYGKTILDFVRSRLEVDPDDMEAGDVFYVSACWTQPQEWRVVFRNGSTVEVERTSPPAAAPTAQAVTQQAAPDAWLATDLDGRGDVAFTKEEAKRRAGEGCTEFVALHDLAPTTSTVSAPDEQDDESDDTCRFCEGQGEVQGQGSAPDIDPPIKKCSECNGSGKAGYYRALRTTNKGDAA